jgi:carbon monoxide dehydrogenase subunit G
MKSLGQKKMFFVLATFTLVVCVLFSQIGLAIGEKSYHNDSFSRSVIISAPPNKVWEILGNPVSLPEWIPGIVKTTYLSKIHTGIGVVREITLDDGTIIEEHFVDWKENEYVSYIMVRGFPLRGYFAKMAMEPLGEGAVLFTWSTYYTTQKMTDEEFEAFASNLRTFFEKSLVKLKLILEE